MEYAMSKYDPDFVDRKRAEGWTWRELATYYNVKHPAVFNWDKRRKKKEKKEKEQRRNETHRRAQGNESAHVKSFGGTDYIDRPDYIDTRSWSWEQYAITYLEDDFQKPLRLLPPQVDDLKAMETIARLIINDPRRTGKTTVIERVFVIRKLTETVFHDHDEPIMYGSAIPDNIDFFVMMIANELAMNPKIRKNFGYLIEEMKIKGRSTAKQTMSKLTLTTRKGGFVPSLYGANLGGRYRGTGARWIIIDDPIDLFNPSEIPKMTKKVVKTIKEKITPIAKNASILLMGTRYDILDLYKIIGDEGTYTWIVRKTIIKKGEYSFPADKLMRDIKPSDILIPNPDDWEILMPELWENNPTDPKATAIQNVMYMYLDIKDRAFSQEFQNDPKPLNAVLKKEKLRKVKLELRGEQWFIDGFDANSLNWLTFYDDATGETEGSNYRSLALVGAIQNKYYILDMIAFQKVSLEKYHTIRDFVIDNMKLYNLFIPLNMECVRAQRESYQWMERYGNLPSIRESNPRERGKKTYRIKNNFAIKLDEEKIHVVENCRFLDHLELEMDGFPHIHPDLLDAVDQATFHLDLGMEIFAVE